MGEECKYHFKGSTKYRLTFWNKAWLISTGLNIVTELDCRQKSKDRAHMQLLWNKFNFLDRSSWLFFPDLLLRIYAWFELARVKLYRNDDLKGKQDYILPVSGRFELGRFRVTGSRLYVPILSILHARHRDCNELHFHALSRYYLSSAFWPKFLLSPGLILCLNARHSKSNVRKSNSIEFNPWIEFDWVRLSSAIERNRTPHFQWVRFPNKSNSIEHN